MIKAANFSNPLNLRLYKNTPDSPPISNNLHYQTTKVQVYNSEGKIELISAYNFHPDKTNWWKSILHWCIEFIWGKTAVLVNVHGEASPLYLRVDELKKVLHISNHLFVNDAHQYLLENQKTVTLNKVKKFVCEKEFFWNKTHQESITALIERLGYRNIFELFENNELGIDQTTLSKLLVDLGKELIQKHQSMIIKKKTQEKYGYTISLPDIFIWKKEDDIKIKINLHTLVMTKEINSPSVNSRNTSVLSNFFSNQNTLDKLASKAQFEDMAIKLDHEKNLNHLQNLAKHVDFSILLDILGRLEEDEKKIMINTFVEIGKELRLPKIFQKLVSLFITKYKKKQKIGSRVISHAFAISKSNIFINQKKFAEGSYKIISTALRINDLSEPFIRVKTKKQPKTGNSLIDFISNQSSINETKLESKLLEKLYKTNNPYLMLPYSCEIESMGEILILFQIKYDGEGTDLKAAPIFQQLAALADYAKGLSLMHRVNYIHMDVKPGNILFQGDLNDLVIPIKGKVSDFGMTCLKGTHIKGGSPAYLPPEVFSCGCFNLNGKTDANIDSFSLGVTIYEIIMNWEIDKALSQFSDHELDIFFLKAKCTLSQSNDYPIQYAVLEVARNLLHTNPTKRISCDEAAKRLVQIQNKFYPKKNNV
jgi:hypothetical protein